MKKLLLAAFIIAGIAACNSPQRMTSPNGDSTVNTTTTDSTGTTMGGDTMKRDSMR